MPSITTHGMHVVVSCALRSTIQCVGVSFTKNAPNAPVYRVWALACVVAMHKGKWASIGGSLLSTHILIGYLLTFLHSFISPSLWKRLSACGMYCVTRGFIWCLCCNLTEDVQTSNTQDHCVLIRNRSLSFSLLSLDRQTSDKQSGSMSELDCVLGK